MVFQESSSFSGGLCDKADFGSGWVFRSTWDYHNPFPLHTLYFAKFFFLANFQNLAGQEECDFKRKDLGMRFSNLPIRLYNKRALQDV